MSGAPRRSAAILLAASLAAFLGACAVGPRFTKPTTPPSGAGAFQSTAAPGHSVADPLPPGWWRLYRDPSLDALVGEALIHNTDLRVAAANLAYAQALLSEARAGRFPSTEATAGGPTYALSPARSFSAATSSTSYTAAFTASYQVDLFGRIRRAIQAARANAEAVQAAEDATRVTVAADTASAYANVCGYGEQLDVARRSLTLVQETYALTVAQRDAGALSDFDVAREAAILAQAKATIAPLEGQRQASLFALAALVGRTPAQVPAEAAACRAPPRLDRALPVGDGAALLRRRPDLREAEYQLAAATARIGVATADLYPTVTLGGSVNYADSLAGNLSSGTGTSYSVGPGLTWTFPNILTARAHIEETGAQASAALASFDGVVLTALKEAETTLSAYGAELDHHRALAEAQAAADEAQRLANVQYRAGAASFLDLITAEQTAVAADQALSASDQALSADQVAVFQALGGGWEGAPAVTVKEVPGR